MMCPHKHATSGSLNVAHSLAYLPAAQRAMTCQHALLDYNTSQWYTPILQTRC